MNKVKEFIQTSRFKMQQRISRFLESEEGDTNIITMVLIIGVAVVLIGVFLIVGQGFIEQLGGKLTGWLDNLF